MLFHLPLHVFLAQEIQDVQAHLVHNPQHLDLQHSLYVYLGLGIPDALDLLLALQPALLHVLQLVPLLVLFQQVDQHLVQLLAPLPKWVMDPINVLKQQRCQERIMISMEIQTPNTTLSMHGCTSPLLVLGAM